MADSGRQEGTPSASIAMDPEGIHADAAIAALREQGAHGFDPLRFRFIEALARRASVHAGDTRRLLDRRLAEVLSAYVARFDVARSEADATLGGMEGRFPPEAANQARRLVLAGEFDTLRRFAARLERRQHRGPLLAGLVRHIVERSAEHGRGGFMQPGFAAEEAGSAAELKTLTYFRSTWSKLSVDQRLNQAVSKVPENAGPLNSHGLALRALQLMRDLSPAYLHRFMSHLDALLWLDQAHEPGVVQPVQKEVVRGDGEKRRNAGRRKPK